MTEQTFTLGQTSYSTRVVVEQVTLRDQFAMAALTGMLAANCDKYIAPIWAYEVADYMLGARKEKK